MSLLCLINLKLRYHPAMMVLIVVATEIATQISDNKVRPPLFVLRPLSSESLLILASQLTCKQTIVYLHASHLSANTRCNHAYLHLPLLEVSKAQKEPSLLVCRHKSFKCILCTGCILSCYPIQSECQLNSITNLFYLATQSNQFSNICIWQIGYCSDLSLLIYCS